MDNEALSHVVG